MAFWGVICWKRTNIHLIEIYLKRSKVNEGQKTVEANSALINLFEQKIMISQETLEKFKIIYKKRFGVELSNQDTLDKANRLLRIIEIIYKPMTAGNYEKLQKRRQKMGTIK